MLSTHYLLSVLSIRAIFVFIEELLQQPSHFKSLKKSIDLSKCQCPVLSVILYGLIPFKMILEVPMALIQSLPTIKEIVQYFLVVIMQEDFWRDKNW